MPRLLRDPNSSSFRLIHNPDSMSFRLFHDPDFMTQPVKLTPYKPNYSGVWPQSFPIGIITMFLLDIRYFSI